jgi:two-component system sensor histidine kinase EvgS
MAATRNNSVDAKSISRKLISKTAQERDLPLQALVVEDHPASRQIISLQLQALGIEVHVCESAHAALEYLSKKSFDILLTDQSIPGMQGSELAKYVRSLGYCDMVIIGITADIYALDSRHQFLAAGMNGVLIKPLSLMMLENELSRHFTFVEITDQKDPVEASEVYSFKLFSNLLKQNPSHIRVILDEVKKVHLETLAILNTGTFDECTLASMIHKVKGGAQLLSAQRFTESCSALETVGPLADRVNAFIALLEEQNHIIERYESKYSNY